MELDAQTEKFEEVGTEFEKRNKTKAELKRIIQYSVLRCLITDIFESH